MHSPSRMACLYSTFCMISCFNVLSIICLLKEQRICSVAFLGNSDVLCRFQLSHILQGERHRGGLSRNGSHRLVCLNAQSIGSGTIRGITLLEEVYHCGGRFEVSYAQVTPIPVSCGSGYRTLNYLSRTMSACMLSCFLP